MVCIDSGGNRQFTISTGLKRGESSVSPAAPPCDCLHGSAAPAPHDTLATGHRPRPCALRPSTSKTPFHVGLAQLELGPLVPVKPGLAQFRKGPRLPLAPVSRFRVRSVGSDAAAE